MNQRVLYELEQDRVRGACRLPLEVIFHAKRGDLRVWLSQGDGRRTTPDELRQYAQMAEDWAEALRDIAHVVDNPEDMTEIIRIRG